VKKGDLLTGSVESLRFPNIGIVETEGTKVKVKNVLPGEVIEYRLLKLNHGSGKGRLQRVLQPSSFETRESCPHFRICGGCLMQTVPYEKQISIKEDMMKNLFHDVLGNRFDEIYEGIMKSPEETRYRNKMEFSFGDEEKDGSLRLGLHKRGSFYDIEEVRDCRICDKTFNEILSITADFFREKNITYFHKMSHKGYLRHLLVRKSVSRKEYLIDLVTSDQVVGFDEDAVLNEWKERLLSSISGISGILHTHNNSLSDAVINERTDIIFGRDYITERILGLDFNISPFSFFQTNSLGAEVLYSLVRDYALTSGGEKPDEIFDLYSGTGTIAEILSPSARHVTGVEIVEEAVEAARENAGKNGLNNCDFIAGDVFKVLNSLSENPDLIILDPPRDGVSPKALKKILSYGVDRIIYIACKPSSLARDIPVMRDNGYKPERLSFVDMFPATQNVEAICMFSLGKY
jgi:23S rRNA (uracil-5-)-methyltransferase RumA